MKRTESIVIASGGPYRVLNERARQQRRRLLKEIKFLEKGVATLEQLKWRHCLYLLIVSAFGIYAGISCLSMASGSFAFMIMGLFCLLFSFLMLRVEWPSIRFAMFARRHGNLKLLLQQKYKELIELTPE